MTVLTPNTDSRLLNNATINHVEISMWSRVVTENKKKKKKGKKDVFVSWLNHRTLNEQTPLVNSLGTDTRTDTKSDAAAERSC